MSWNKKKFLTNKHLFAIKMTFFKILLTKAHAYNVHWTCIIYFIYHNNNNIFVHPYHICFIVSLDCPLPLRYSLTFICHHRLGHTYSLHFLFINFNLLFQWNFLTKFVENYKISDMETIWLKHQKQLLTVLQN